MNKPADTRTEHPVVRQEGQKPKSASAQAPSPLQNFCRNSASAFLAIRWGYAVIAFALSVTLWYTVTVRDKIESWVDVQVVFKGAPEGVVLRDGLINKISVRVRAARGLSRSLAERPVSVAIDLSSIVKGPNTILITPEMLPFNTAYEIVEISPPAIRIEADSMASRESTLDVRFEGALSGDFFVKSLHAIPPKVSLRGPAGVLNSLGSVRLPVPLHKDLRTGVSTVTIPLVLPAGVTADPVQVAVELEISVRTKPVKVTRDVKIGAYKDGRVVSLSPGRVSIVVDVPEALVKDAATMAGIAASVSLPPDMETEPLTLPVEVTVPEYGSLVSVTPKEVTVTPARR